MTALSIFLLLLSLPPGKPDTSREILDAFTGHWKGTFKVYAWDGHLTEKLEVDQRYWWEGDEQRGVFIDKYTNGRTVHSRATNTAKDGTLTCEVEKSTGERTTHTGRYEDGVLFWYRRSGGGRMVESFKERVVETPGGREYQIDGFGVYGKGESATYLLYEGRYREVK